MAQYNLGVCYANGQGVAKDEVGGGEVVSQGRRAELRRVLNTIWAICYHDGQGVAKDDVEAVKWYRKAAEQNHALAQYNLGVLLPQWPRRGEG